MTKDLKHSTIGKLLGYTGLILFGLILLGAIFRFSLKSSFMLNLAGRSIEAALSSNGSKLEIGEIDGDAWSQILLRNVHYRDAETEWAISEIQLNYNFVQALFGETTLDEVHIRGAVGQSLNRDKSGNTSGSKSASRRPPVQIQVLQITQSAFNAEQFSLQDIELSGTASLSDSSSVKLRQFSASLLTQAAKDTVFISTQADYKNGLLNLNELILKSGQSLLNTSVKVEVGAEEIEAEGDGDQVLLLDFISGRLPELFNRPFQINEISADGTFDAFRIGLSGSSAETGDFNLSLSFLQDSLITISNGSLKLTSLALDQPVEKVNSLQTENLELRVDFRQQRFRLGIDQLFINEEYFQRLDAEGLLIGDQLFSDIDLLKTEAPERIQAEIRAIGFFSELGIWSVEGRALSLDPAWLLDERIDGKLDLEFSVRGDGTEPGERPWIFELESPGGEIVGQPLDRLRLKGKLNRESLNLDLRAGIRGSSFQLTANSTTDSENPEYEFTLQAGNINLGDITGFSQTRSNLSLQLEGQGRGIRSDNLQLDIKSRLEDGTLNTGRIDDFAADVSIRNEFIRVENAIIRSTFADGTISAYQNYTDFSDPENRTDFLLRIKDLNPLASVFNLQTLKASGEITGSINQTSDGFSFFTTDYDLVDITLDDYLKSKRASGKGEILFGNENSYSLELDVLGPELGILAFEDFRVSTFGLVDMDSVRGRYDMRLGKVETGTIQQSGVFRFEPQEFLLESNLQQFDISAEGENYQLEDDFNFRWSPDEFVTDTLSLAGTDNSYFWMSWTRINDEIRRCFVKTDSMNIGRWQSLMLKEKIVDGILSGEFELLRENEEVEANGIAEILGLQYKTMVTEKISTLIDIQNEQLDLDVIGRWGNEDKLFARMSVPFSLSDPERFATQFADEPVQGELSIRDTELSRFKDLLAFARLGNVQGKMEADLLLSGTAGNPEFRRELVIRNPVISGVALDSLVSTSEYTHSRENLDLQASLFTGDQEAVILDARVPFSIDLQNFSLNVPEADDPIFMKLTTDDLDLAVLDDFLNPDFMTDVYGKAEGQLTLQGPFSAPVPRGDIQILDASFEVPFTQVRINGLNASFRVDSGLIEIQQFTGQSAGGLLDARGSVELAGITAQAMDVDIEAADFLVSDTRDARIRLSARNRLSGDIQSPELRGSFKLENGFLYSSKLGEGGVETINLESDTLGLILAQTLFYQRMNVDADITLGRDFSFRNRDYLTIDISGLEGEINAVKESYGALALLGSLNSETGYARPLGKRFELEEANFIFDGDPFNPAVYNNFGYTPVRSRRSTEQQVFINYIIEGTLEEPEYRFESDPPMDRKDIISYVLFDQPYYRLGPVEQLLVSTNSNEDVDEESLDLLLSRMEQLATQAFGVDMVDVNPIRIGRERGTAIHTGWYLNDRTFFRIVNEIGANTPKTLFMLEYLVNQNLDLIITQGNDRRQGVDLQWIFEY